MEHLSLSLSLSLSGSFTRGTWRGGSFTGNPEGYVKENSGNRHLSPQESGWGTLRGFVYRGLSVTVKEQS